MNPLIIIIIYIYIERRGGRTQTDAVVLVVARAALRYYVTTLSMHARAMERREARTKGQSSFSGSFLPYYPCLAVRLTRHAYKAVFIVAVTGQQAVRDLSRRGEVERIFIQVSKH